MKDLCVKNYYAKWAVYDYNILLTDIVYFFLASFEGRCMNMGTIATCYFVVIATACFHMAECVFSW